MIDRNTAGLEQKEMDELKREKDFNLNAALFAVCHPSRMNFSDQEKAVRDFEDYLDHKKALELLDQDDYLFDGISEVLASDVTTDGKTNAERIREAIKSSDYYELGRMIAEGVIDYCKDSL